MALLGCSIDDGTVGVVVNIDKAAALAEADEGPRDLSGGDFLATKNGERVQQQVRAASTHPEQRTGGRQATRQDVQHCKQCQAIVNQGDGS
jgi:hypothetical protein